MLIEETKLKCGTLNLEVVLIFDGFYTWGGDSHILIRKPADTVLVVEEHLGSVHK